MVTADIANIIRKNVINQPVSLDKGADTDFVWTGLGR